VTKSVVQTQRQFRWDFPGRNALIRLTIKHLDKFVHTGSAQENIKGCSGQPWSVRTENHIMTVRQCLEQMPRKSTDVCPRRQIFQGAKLYA